MQQYSLQVDNDCGLNGAKPLLQPLHAPTIYSLELTALCNNQCPGCSNVFVTDKAKRTTLSKTHQIPLAEWEKIIDVIAPHATSVKLTGGESTLHPDFHEITDLLAYHQIPFTIFSNGRWRKPQELLISLKSNRYLKGFLISLHGSSPHSHDLFMGHEGAFAETIENISLATNAGYIVHTNTVITSASAREIGQIVELSKNLGARAAVFNRYIGTPIPTISPTPLQLQSAISLLNSLKRAGANVQLGACVPLCFVDTFSTGCLAGTAYCTIDPWGNLKPCNHALPSPGNILVHSLEELWSSKMMDQWRNKTMSSCSGCSLYTTCRGGCRADAFLNNLDIDPLMTLPVLQAHHSTWNSAHQQNRVQ